MVDFGAEERGSPVATYSLTPDGIGIITINRPHARNAVHDYVYLGIIDGLNKAEQDENCKVVVLTGKGDFFSNGADLVQGFDSMGGGPLKSGAGHMYDPVSRFMIKVIKFEKPLIAAVNGPAIGVGCTVLPHCDVVYCSDNTYFWTPFSDLAVCPEFCSSVTFPEQLGRSLANEMLLFGKRLKPEQALARGFVSEIFPKGEGFLESVLGKIRPTMKAYNSGRSMKLFKALIKDDSKTARLLAAHEKEMQLLTDRTSGEDSETSTAMRLRLEAAKAAAAAKKKNSKL